MVEPHLRSPVVGHPRRVVLAVVAALLWTAAAVLGVGGGLDVVRAEQAAVAADPAEQAWSYPPRIVGRADAEVLDVDLVHGGVLLDVGFVGPGRLPTVTWVDATHLDDVPEVGDTVAVAFVPADTEVAFEIDDPGLSDPFDNGFLAYDTPSPAPPSGPARGVVALVIAGLALLGACVTSVAAVTTTGARATTVPLRSW